MSLEHLALAITDDLPIKHEGDVHSGKVRSAYWLGPEDNARVAKMIEGDYALQAEFGVLVISDRLSAFECPWKGQDGLGGVPGKGACLNAVSEHWFQRFEQEGLGGHHIVAKPHPLVWIVQRAEQVMVEAVARQYITGSMWRDYSEGKRLFCGYQLPEGLKNNQRLAELLITPSTKGIMKGIPGIPEKDDVNISSQQVRDNWDKFGFLRPEDVDVYERMLVGGFKLIERETDQLGYLFVDTKFEFGYVICKDGSVKLIYDDEIGTPDSSRYYRKDAYAQGQIVEDSKEGFRQYLIRLFGAVMTDKSLFDERKIIANHFKVPAEEFMKVSETYRGISERITGRSMPKIENARVEICDALAPYGLIK